MHLLHKFQSYTPVPLFIIHFVLYEPMHSIISSFGDYLPLQAIYFPSYVVTQTIFH